MQKRQFRIFYPKLSFCIIFPNFFSDNLASLFTKCNSIQKNVVSAIIEQILGISTILDLL